ncbi:MAG: Endothelial differentiation- factor 1, partial [Paramarteilia canceri]
IYEGSKYDNKKLNKQMQNNLSQNTNKSSKPVGSNENKIIDRDLLNFEKGKKSETVGFEYGKLVAQHRDKASMKQDELASKINIKKEELASIENGTFQKSSNFSGINGRLQRVLNVHLTGKNKGTPLRSK